MRDEITDVLKHLTPMNDTVIAVPFEKIEEIGGIIIPSGSQKQKTKSTVIAVGPGKLVNDEREPMRVKPGDVIFHSEFAGSETQIERKGYLVMRGDIAKNDIYGLYNGERPIDIAPFGDKLLLEWEEGLREYKNTGILRAKGEMDRHYTGVVIAVGPDVLELKVGDRVFFDQFCGPERIDYDDKRYAFIEERDVYCILPLRSEVEVMSQ